MKYWNSLKSALKRRLSKAEKRWKPFRKQRQYEAMASNLLLEQLEIKVMLSAVDLASASLPSGDNNPVITEFLQEPVTVENEAVVGDAQQQAPDLPGMILLDSDMSNWYGQVIYLDFDGAEDVTYNGPVTIENIDVPAFTAPDSLTGQEQAIIADVLTQLQTTFAGTGITFVTEEPETGTQFSTIYIGGNDFSLRHLGNFLGVAEKVDIANVDSSDNALVFPEVLPGVTFEIGQYAQSLTHVISHEAGRLLGYAEPDEPIAPGYEQIMADVNLSFVEIEVDGVRSTNTNDDFYPEQNSEIWIYVKFSHGASWAQPDGGVTITLDNLDDSKAWVTDKSWNGDGDVYYYHNTQIWHKTDGEITAYDPMIEGEEPNWWEWAVDRKLGVKVDLGSETSFDVLTRAWVGDTHLPASGSAIDQQGWPVYKWDIYPKISDTLKPEAPEGLEMTEGDGYYSNTDNPGFDWSEPDDRGGGYITEYRYEVDDDSPDKYSTTSTGVSSYPSNLSNGEHTFYVQARDDSGNWGDVAQIDFYVDDENPVKPSISMSSDEGRYDDDEVTYDRTPQFYLSGMSDSHSGIDQVYWRVDNGSWSNVNEPGTTEYITTGTLEWGSHTFYAYTTDEAGNMSSTSSLAFYVDYDGPNQPGSLKMNNATSYYTNSDDPSFSWSEPNDNHGGSIWQYKYELGDNSPDAHSTTGRSVNFSNLNNGFYTFYVMGQDVAGNLGDVAYYNFFVDDLDPEVPIVYAPGTLDSDNPQVITDLTPRLDWDDTNDNGGSGIHSWEVDFEYLDSYLAIPAWKDYSDYPQTAYNHYKDIGSNLPEDSYRYRVRALDNAGNYSDWSAYVHFDVTVPHVTDLKWENANGDVLTEIDDNNQVWATVYGNSALNGNIVLDIYEDDNIFGLGGGVHDTGWSITVPVTNGYGQASWDAVWRHDDTWGPALPGGTPDPEYFLRYSVDDKNSGELTVVDESGPDAPNSLWMQAGSDTGVTGDDLTRERKPEFGWDETTDPNGIDEYQWEIRTPAGSLVQNGFTGGSDRNDRPDDNLSDGSYKFRVQAKDGNGNWGPWSGDYTFKIDATDPSTPTSLVSPGDITADFSPNVHWNSSNGTGSDIWKYEIVFDDSSWDPDFGLIPERTFWSLDGDTYLDDEEVDQPLYESDWKWWVRAYDKAENESEWAVGDEFTLDSRPRFTDIRRIDTDTDDDGYAHRLRFDIDIWSGTDVSVAIQLFEDDISIFGWGDDPIELPSQQFALSAGQNTIQITVNIDDQEELKTRGTAEFRITLRDATDNDKLDEWDQSDDAALGSVQVERSYHEKTVRDGLIDTFSEFAKEGLEDWHAKTGGKPVLGLSLGAGLSDELLELAGLIGAPATGGGSTLVGAILGALNVELGAGIDTYFDVGDLLGLTEDGHDGWVTVWLGGNVFGSLGLELPYSNLLDPFEALPVKVGFGIQTFNAPTPEYDDPWHFGAGAQLDASVFSATVAGNKWYAGQFGYSADNSWETDWLGADLGNFSTNFGVDAISLEASVGITSFEINRSLLLSALSPIGFNIGHALLELFEDDAVGAVFDDSVSGVSYADILLAGANSDYSQGWIRGVTEPSVIPDVATEVGTAVFRDNVLFGVDWHAGIHWLYDGYADERVVLQANGYSNVLTLESIPLSGVSWDEFLDVGQYRGSRQLEGITPTDANRLAMIEEGLTQYYADYTFSSTESTSGNHPNSAWQTGDGAFRCDMFVEYVYNEVFGDNDGFFSDVFEGIAGLQTPRATYYARNAEDIVVTLPTVQNALFDGDVIDVTFSELMSRGTLDPIAGNAVTVTGSVSGTHEIDICFDSSVPRDDLFIWDGDRNDPARERHDTDRLLITSTKAFVPGETVTLAISDKAKDLGGNAIAQPYVNAWQVGVENPQVNLSVFDSSTSELSNYSTFRIERTGSNNESALTVNFNSPSGSADQDSDYVLKNGSAVLEDNAVTIAAGQSYVDITVEIRNDDIDEDNESVILTLASGAGYTLGTTTSGTVTISDDDTAGVTVTPTSGLVTAEAGDTASFTVRLDSEPTSNVSIDLSSSDTTEGVISSTSLTFTPDNWYQPQTITVTGQQDVQVDGDVDYTIVTAAASSSDAKYNNMAIADVSVTNQDDDVPASAEIEVKQDVTHIVDDVFNINFGSILEDSNGRELVFTINNLGEQVLTLGNIILDNNTDFQITHQPDSSVAGGNSTTFRIKLLAVGFGEKIANVRLDNNDQDENPFNFSIIGTVNTIAPVVTVNTLATYNRTPTLTGTIDDPAAVITVTINGESHTATNLGSTWTLDWPTLLTTATIYDVQVSARDASDNVSTDTTSNELTIMADGVIHWTAFTPSAEHTDIVVAKRDGQWFADVTIEFASSNYRVSDWSTVNQNNNNHVVDTVIEQSDDVTSQTVTYKTHSYALGDLNPGGHTFTFFANGDSVKSQSFNVPAVNISSIAGVVWSDANGDGMQDAGESGLANVSVNLLDDQANVIATTTSDAQGQYVLGDLNPGDYQIEVVSPGGQVLTFQNQGSDDTLDSDVDAGTGRTSIISVVDGDAITSVDAGLFDPYAGTPIQWAENGHWYQVIFAPSGIDWDTAWAEATSMTHDGLTGHLVSLTSESENTYVTSLLDGYVGAGAWIGLREPTAGRWIWESGEFLEYVNWSGGQPDNQDNAMRAVILGASTAYSGKWDDRILDNAYVVEFTPPTEPVRWEENGHYYQLGYIPNEPGWDAARDMASSMTYKGISGHLATVTTDTENAFIDQLLADKIANFTYLGGHKVDGQWQWVTGESFSYTNWDSGEPNNANGSEIYLTLMPDNNGRWNDLDFKGRLFLIEYDVPMLGSISGKVWTDTNGNGVHDVVESGQSEVLINLLVADGTVVASTTSDTQGQYTFNDLNPGDYQIEVVSPGGQVLTFQNQGSDDTLDSDVDAGTGRTSLISVAAGDEITSVDAGLFDPFAAEPVQWSENGHWYQVIYAPSGIDWDTAWAEATSMTHDGLTGHLVSLTSESENTYVTSLLDGYVGEGAWTGLFESTVSTWHWANGDHYQYSNWSGSQPDNQDNAKHAVIQGSSMPIYSGKWDDRIWDQAYVVEYTPPTAPVQWSENGHYYQLGYIPDEPGWDAAQDLAESMSFMGVSGHLATLTTNSENNFVDQLLDGVIGNFTFLGGEKVDGQWQWVTGETFAYTNWDSGEPNNANGFEMYLTLMPDNNGRWNDLDFKGRLYLVEYDVALPVSISGMSWDDVDANGIQDSDESGLAGVTVNLLDDQGAVVTTTTSDTQGQYAFNDLVPGDYQVEFVRPTGQLLTFQNQGSDDTLDSDADASTGRTSLISVTTGDEITSVDAGMFDPFAADPVQWSENGHWYQVVYAPEGINHTNAWDIAIDVTHDGLNGHLVAVTSQEENDFVESLLSGYAGEGAWIGISENSSFGWIWRTGEMVNYTNWSAGQPDNQGNAMHAVIQGPAESSNSGKWDDRVSAQAYVIEFSPPDLPVFWEGNGHYYQVIHTPNVVDWEVVRLEAQAMSYKGVYGHLATITTPQENDFIKNMSAGIYNSMSIGGYQVDGGVEPSGGWQWVTGESWSFTNWLPGNPDNSGGIEHYMSINVSGNNIDPSTGWNDMIGRDRLYLIEYDVPYFGSISGALWDDAITNGLQDAGEIVLSDVVVNLLDDQGIVVSTTTSDSMGEYLFDNLIPGNYQVDIVRPTNFSFTPQDVGSDDSIDSDVDDLLGRTSVFTLSAGEVKTGIDAGLFEQVSTYRKSSEFFLNSDDLSSPILQSFGNQAVIADWNGIKNAIESGEMTISEFFYQTNLSDGGKDWNHSIAMVSVGGSTSTGNAYFYIQRFDDGAPPNFGVRDSVGSLYLGSYSSLNMPVLVSIEPISISGGVWSDTNGNGVQDAGELGIVDVVVNLFDTDGIVVATTTSDAQGQYAFNDLSAGDYQVQFVRHTNYGFVPENIGSDDTLDSDVDVISGRSDVLTLSAGISVEHLDAGWQEQSSLYRGTVELYSETENLGSIVEQAFGVGATIADWSDIKAALESGELTFDEFYEQTNLSSYVHNQKGSEAIVQRGGEMFYGSTNRQYYVQRFDGGPYAGFLVHDQIGTLYLGSWYGLNMSVLASTSIFAGPDQTVNEGSAVSFTGSLADAGTADTHTILWDFGDGSTTSGTLLPDHVYAEDGVYTVTLTVTDDDGGQASDTLQITVSNIDPVISSLSDDQSIYAKATAHFTATATDAAGENDPLTYTWDFGDGSDPISGIDQTAVEYTYSSIGSYTVTLTVSDDDGGSVTQTRSVQVLPAEVAGRFQFFNGTVYDGNGQTVNASDLAAVTDSLAALFPGDQASDANYTSYINGITGIVIEVDNLLDPDEVTLDDFELTVGNNNQTDQWEQAPTPTLTLLQKSTAEEPDRFFLHWDDQAVMNTWLSVRILANANTSLAEEDVFYFGNMTGDVDGDGNVSIADVFAIWNNRIASSEQQANANNRYDINKDGWVNITDVFAAWNNRTNATGQWLNMIQPPAQQVQVIENVAPQQSENRLALALASMQGQYSLSVVASDTDRLSLTEVSISDYL